MDFDPNNPLFDSTYPVQPSTGSEDFDIVNRIELIRITAPFYGNDVAKWVVVLDELEQWVYGPSDSIEFTPDAAESEN